MRVQVVYCNHHSADLHVREQLAFPSDEQLARGYTLFRNRFPETEVVLLSTCNRVEIYTTTENDENALTDLQIAKFLSDFHQLPLDSFVNELLEQTNRDAVEHLYNVVTSLDSMVLGEPQIVNQIKHAYEQSQENNACGPMSNLLFQGALRVSGRVRTETMLAEGRVSIASVAVGDFGKNIFDRFDDKTVLIIGAGEMAEETTRYLKQEGANSIVVVNRSPERAVKLAEQCGGIAKPFDELDHWLGEADVIVSTTGAERPIVDAARFSEARKKQASKKSPGKPVFILDLGAPRDFEQSIAEIDDNVFLYDIDDLEATCRQNRKTRRKEIEAAQQIIGEETDRFMGELHHRATGPTIKQLRDVWHDIRLQELEMLKRKLPDLDENEFQMIERSLERIVNKLLHPPLSALRDESKSGPPDGLLNALKRLFHLPD